MRPISLDSRACSSVFTGFGVLTPGNRFWDQSHLYSLHPLHEEQYKKNVFWAKVCHPRSENPLFAVFPTRALVCDEDTSDRIFFALNVWLLDYDLQNKKGWVLSPLKVGGSVTGFSTALRLALISAAGELWQCLKSVTKLAKVLSWQVFFLYCSLLGLCSSDPQLDNDWALMMSEVDWNSRQPSHSSWNRTDADRSAVVGTLTGLVECACAVGHATGPLAVAELQRCRVKIDYRKKHWVQIVWCIG